MKACILAEWWTDQRSQYFNRFLKQAQGRCFLDLQHSEAFMFFADRARYKKRSSTAKELLLGVFFSTEGPQDKNTFGKMIQKSSLLLPKVLKTKTLRRGNIVKCRSYHQLRFNSSRRRKDHIDLSNPGRL
jgi:hypothetical protein